MRLPAALKWLAIGVMGWTIWRVPVVLHDFAALRSAVHSVPPPPIALRQRQRIERPSVSLSPPTPPTSFAKPVGTAAHLLKPAGFNPIRLAGPEPLLPPQPPSVLSPPAPTIAEPRPAADSPPTGADLATRAYDALRLGDRKSAAALLAQAIETAPDDPRAAAWAADRRALVKRWSGDAYVLVRRGETAPTLGATPTLGGSQAGARLGYVLNPLADQRVTISGRIYQPLVRHSGGADAAQAVAGLELKPAAALPLTIAIDRYVALGSRARNAWAIGLAGGVDDIPVVSGMSAGFYAQAGVIGLHSRDGYADARLSLHAPIINGPLRLKAGAGLWGGAQPGARRLDAGPTVEVSGRIGRVRIAADIDWRIRTTGNARPGNGPALTFRAGF